MVLGDIRAHPIEDGYRPVTLVTSRGDVALRYYERPGATCGAIFVGGVGGDFDSPGGGRLYPELCNDLVHGSIAALRVRFRHPTMLDEAVLDVLAGLRFLTGNGIDAAALTGHSFGGAVVLEAAARSAIARTVVTLATQAAGAEAAAELPPDCSALFIHGTADDVLTPECSRYAYQLAHEPKELVLYDGAHHGLEEVAAEVREQVREWIVDTPDG
jgi:pimeloyl-ACP methyl ester carboxylesterase